MALQICQILLAEEGTYFYTGANKELKNEIQKVKTVKSGVSKQSWQSGSCVILDGFNSHTDFANALCCFHSVSDSFSEEIQELS